jgi:hypothetical protein
LFLLYDDARLKLLGLGVGFAGFNQKLLRDGSADSGWYSWEGGSAAKLIVSAS